MGSPGKTRFFFAIVASLTVNRAAFWRGRTDWKRICVEASSPRREGWRADLLLSAA
jgi:hypothetical protein